MDFKLTEDQELYIKTIRRFVEKEIKPVAAKIDEAGVFPENEFQKVGKLGFFGLRYPESIGGSNASKLTFILAVEELAKGSLSLALLCSMQSLMGTYFLYRSGNKKIFEKYLIPALKGEKIGAICMTEPDAGSDLASFSTKAVKDGDHYIINGEKIWVTSAQVADFFTVFAKTKSADGKEGLTPFLVGRDTKGLIIGKNIEKISVLAAPAGEITLDHCQVPESNILGVPGKGLEYLKEILVEIRIMAAALSLGVGQAALDEAISYANQRDQFGQKIKEFQAIKLKIADMTAAIESSRLYIYYAAWRSDQGMPNMKEATIAKLCASEAANMVCDQASRIMASYGLAKEYPMQRFFRDARFILFGGGTSEILKLIISKEVGC
jgi:alkylation response protein AidB-like acyl-CoA dehydrogenase